MLALVRVTVKATNKQTNLKITTDSGTDNGTQFTRIITALYSIFQSAVTCMRLQLQSFRYSLNRSTYKDGVCVGICVYVCLCVLFHVPCVDVLMKGRIWH